MRCAIYTRVSTDTQAEVEFNSCKAQGEKIRAFIKSQNRWQVAKVYSDPSYSGPTLKLFGLGEYFKVKRNKNYIIYHD